MRTLIDTRIWALGLKSSYYSEADSIKPLAQQAQAFLNERLAEDVICLSAQIVSELHHVLTARGRRVSKPDAAALITDLLTHEHVEFRVHNQAMLTRAIALSTQTCIHIWDFLTVLPFQGVLDRIYSMDPHFQSCRELQIAPVENPFGAWSPEGRSEP